MASEIAELELSVYTPTRALFKNEAVKSISVVTTEGEIQVLPQHVNYMSILTPGVFKFEKKKNNEKVIGVISSGTIEVRGKQIILTAETLELSNEIDAERALHAEKEARQKLAGAKDELDAESFEKHQLKLQRALIRQQATKTH